VEETPKFTVCKIHNHAKAFEQCVRCSTRGALRMRNKQSVGKSSGRDYLEDLDIDRRKVLKLSFMEIIDFVKSVTSSTQITRLKCCVHTHIHTHT
jgi:hypothetical protein